MRNSYITSKDAFSAYDRLILFYAKVERPTKILSGEWIIDYSKVYDKIEKKIKCRCQIHPTVHDLIEKTNTKVCTECNKLSRI